jgi:CBS domain-containing protein
VGEETAGPGGLSVASRGGRVDKRGSWSKLGCKLLSGVTFAQRKKMKTVQQLLDSKRPRLVAVSPDTTVLDALKVMAEKEIGAVLVLDGETLAGIFSERDYARKVVLQGKSSKETPVREIMTEKVVCVQPQQTIDDCMGLMTDKRIRHLPVLEHKKVIGVISIGDVVKEMLSEKEFVIKQLESYIHN